MLSGVPRVSNKELLILELLSDRAERYGLEMVDASAGALRRGTIYVTLGRMDEKGYVTSRLSERDEATAPGPPRRMYRVTANGARVLAACRAARKAFLRMAPRSGV